MHLVSKGHFFRHLYIGWNILMVIISAISQSKSKKSKAFKTYLILSLRCICFYICPNFKWIYLRFIWLHCLFFKWKFENVYLRFLPYVSQSRFVSVPFGKEAFLSEWLGTCRLQCYQIAAPWPVWRFLGLLQW